MHNHWYVLVVNQLLTQEAHKFDSWLDRYLNIFFGSKGFFVLLFNAIPDTNDLLFHISMRDTAKLNCNNFFPP